MENSKGKESESLLQVVHIEDNEYDSELIRLALEEGGTPCNITRVVTRDEFQSALEDKPVDLVLSDSQVPGFDALSALADAHKQKPDLPFVFVSGNGSPRLKEKALAGGATGFVPKDNLAGLVDIVRELGKKKAVQVPKRLPKVGQFVIVQCEGFRCMGFLDSEGIWRDFERREPLPKVIDWFEV